MFVFVGLRHKGEELSDAMQRVNKFPMKMVTVFSISTSGSLCYRLDEAEDEDVAQEIRNGILPLVPHDKTVLFSLPYSDALKLVQQRIWAYPNPVTT